MPLIRAEAGAAAAVACLASALISAYLADWLGLAIVPFAILARFGRAAVVQRHGLSRCDVDTGRNRGER